MMTFSLITMHPSAILVRNLVFMTKTQLQEKLSNHRRSYGNPRVSSFGIARENQALLDTCAKFTACYNLIQCSIFCKFGSESVCWLLGMAEKRTLAKIYIFDLCVARAIRAALAFMGDPNTFCRPSRLLA